MFSDVVYNGIHICLTIEDALNMEKTWRAGKNIGCDTALLEVEVSPDDFVAAGEFVYDDDNVFDSAVYHKVKLLREVVV